MSKWGDVAESKADVKTLPASLGLPAVDAPKQTLVSEEMVSGFESGRTDGKGGPDTPLVVFRTVTEQRVNEDGKLMLVTKKFRMVKKEVQVNDVTRRRSQWRKFGECAGVSSGPEPGVTAVDGEHKWNFKYLAASDLAKKEAKERAQRAAAGMVEEKEQASLGIVCRSCGRTGDHWTHQCPYKNQLGAIAKDSDAPDANSTLSAIEKVADAVAAGRGYTAPGALAAGEKKEGPKSMFGRNKDDRYGDDSTTVRVSNLAEQTQENDLWEIFRVFGPVSRVFLGVDRDTGMCKGYAFVTFDRRESAAASIEALSDKKGLHHVIIHCQWSNR